MPNMSPNELPIPDEVLVLFDGALRIAYLATIRPDGDLATVPIGTCVELQLRNSTGNDALDLFGVDCEHRDGVYTVTARVRSNNQCNSVYVAAPPDRSFALCLNPY